MRLHLSLCSFRTFIYLKIAETLIYIKITGYSKLFTKANFETKELKIYERFTFFNLGFYGFIYKLNCFYSL